MDTPKQTVEKILVAGVRTTSRLCFEAAIATVEELEQTPPSMPVMPASAFGYFDAGYQKGLADVKEKLQILLAAFAE